MAKAYVHSHRGDKSALIGVTSNEFQFGWDHAYVPRKSVEKYTPMVDSEGEKTEEYDTFEIPDGYTLVPMVDEDGEVRTAKNGEPLKVLSWS